MQEEIKKHVEPPSNTEPVNAAEAANLLPIKHIDHDPAKQFSLNGESISQPVQRGTSSPTPRVQPPDPPDPPGPPDDPNPHQPPNPVKPPVPLPIVQSNPLGRAKFRTGGRSDTHGLVIQIPPFTKRLNNIQVQAVTEQGQDIAQKIQRVWCNGKEVKPKQHKIPNLKPNGQSPVTLEIVLQDPVDGRRFRLRTAQEK